MLNLFLALIDQVVKLLGLRDARARRAFLEIYDPTYNQLKSIHDDYIETLSSVRASLAKEGNEFLDDFHYNTAGMSKNRVKHYTVDGFDSISYKWHDELDKQLDVLYERRLKFQSIRAAVRATAVDAILNSRSKREKDFAEAVRGYFPGTYLAGMHNYETSVTTNLIRRLWHCDHGRSLMGYVSSEEVTAFVSLIRLVDDLIVTHNSRWDLVCKSYAELRREIVLQ